MESKHTPGPWITEITQTYVWVGTPKNNETKCDNAIFGVEIEGLKDEYVEKNIANARLASCAPEMLEALKQNLITIKDLLMAIGPEDELPIDQDLRVAESPEIIKLKAIIKKAEGGKQ